MMTPASAYTWTLLALSLPASATDTCAVRSGAQVVPLVELYTSEGCSSCPPADRWLSAQLADHTGEPSVNWLAFHVDYWDAIGWPDRFAAPAHSERQRQRVAATGGRNVYTPQVMVGTQVNTDWGSDARLRAALTQARVEAPAALALRLQPAGAGWRVALGASRTPAARDAEAQVWLVSYSDDQHTQVRAGENRGARLRHDRVVRAMHGPWPLTTAPLSQALTLAAPSPRWGVTAFVQDRDGRVWQSLTLSADDCGNATASR